MQMAMMDEARDAAERFKTEFINLTRNPISNEIEKLQAQLQALRKQQPASPEEGEEETKGGEVEGSGSADNIAKLETRLAELEEELRRKSDKKRDEIQELLERARDAGGDRPEDVNIVLVIEKLQSENFTEKLRACELAEWAKKERECVLKELQRLHMKPIYERTKPDMKSRIEDLETVVNKLSKLKLQADLEHASEEQDELRGKLDEALQCKDDFSKSESKDSRKARELEDAVDEAESNLMHAQHKSLEMVKDNHMHVEHQIDSQSSPSNSSEMAELKEQLKMLTGIVKEGFFNEHEQ